MTQVKDLINAMDAGKSLDIEASFNEIMATKMVSALDTRRDAIASNLFAGVQEESVDESVEELDELSKGTLTSYADKRNWDAGGRLDTDVALNAAKKKKDAAGVATHTAKLKKIDSNLDKVDARFRKMRNKG